MIVPTARALSTTVSRRRERARSSKGSIRDPGSVWNLGREVGSAGRRSRRAWDMEALASRGGRREWTTADRSRSEERRVGGGGGGQGGHGGGEGKAQEESQ